MVILSPIGILYKNKQRYGVRGDGKKERGRGGKRKEKEEEKRGEKQKDNIHDKVVLYFRTSELMKLSTDKHITRHALVYIDCNQRCDVM